MGVGKPYWQRNTGAINSSGLTPLSKELLASARRLNVNPNTLNGRRVLENLKTTAAEYISKYRKASVRAEFPEEYLNSPIEEILKNATTTVRKLLIDGRFAK